MPVCMYSFSHSLIFSFFLFDFFTECEFTFSKGSYVETQGRFPEYTRGYNSMKYEACLFFFKITPTETKTETKTEIKTETESETKTEASPKDISSSTTVLS